MQADAACSHWRRCSQEAVELGRAAARMGYATRFDKRKAEYEAAFSASLVAAKTTAHAHYVWQRARARAERERQRYEIFKRIAA